MEVDHTLNVYNLKSKQVGAFVTLRDQTEVIHIRVTSTGEEGGGGSKFATEPNPI